MNDHTQHEDFVNLLTGHQRRLWAYLFTLLGDRELADECLQETNLVLWRKSGQFTLGTNFSAWAMRVAQLQARALRKRARRDSLLLSDADFDALAERSTRRAADDRLAALRSCLDELSPRQLDALRRYYGGTVGLGQIGRSIGVAAGALKGLLHRTRVQLLECVKRKTRGEGVVA